MSEGSTRGQPKKKNHANITSYKQQTTLDALFQYLIFSSFSLVGWLVVFKSSANKEQIRIARNNIE